MVALGRCGRAARLGEHPPCRRRQCEGRGRGCGLHDDERSRGQRRGDLRSRREGHAHAGGRGFHRRQRIRRRARSAGIPGLPRADGQSSVAARRECRQQRRLGVRREPRRPRARGQHPLGRRAADQHRGGAGPRVRAQRRHAEHHRVHAESQGSPDPDRRIDARARHGRLFAGRLRPQGGRAHRHGPRRQPPADVRGRRARSARGDTGHYGIERLGAILLRLRQGQGAPRGRGGQQRSDRRMRSSATAC